MADRAEVIKNKIGFWQQLRLLLWKNFTLKRRSPIVFALEVLIPLVLFIILVLIRRSEEPKHMGITTFSPRALPSAGMVPVFQSFCDANDEEVFNETNKRLTTFLEAVQHVIKIGMSDETIRAGSFQHLPDLIGRMAFMNKNGMGYGTSNSTESQSEQSYNESESAKVLESVLKISRDLSGNLSYSSIDYDKVKLPIPPAMPMTSGTLFKIAADLLPLLKPDNSQIDIQNILEILKMAVAVVKSLPEQKCKPEGSSMAENPSNLQTNFTEKFEDLLKFWFMLRPALCSPEQQSNMEDMEKSANRNLTLAERFHEEFEAMSSDRRKYLSLLTRLLYGNPKILFAPNNTAANRIIEKVNETFVFYGNVTAYAKKWLNISDGIRAKTSASSEVYGVLLSPLFDAMDKLACAWLSVFNGIDLDVFRGFSSEKDLEVYFLNQQYHDNISVIAGVVFENLHNSTTELPPHIHYKIRQNATFNPTTKVVRNKLWFPSPGSYYLKYYYFGFVWIQDLVERAIIDLQAGRTVVEPGLLLHRMPYPCWLWGNFIWLIQHVVPLCFMLSWVYPVAMLVQRIVYEKEQRLKEVMKMMGLSNAVHWCAWFITAFVQVTIIMTVLTFMMHYGKILPYSNPWIVFLYLQLFALSSIAFSFLISSCFSKAKLAAACAGIFYFLAYIPYIYISIKEDISESGIMSASLKTAVSLFSTTALGLGGKYFLYYELEGVGCQWDNLMVSPRENDQFTLFLVLLMMVIDSFLYFLLAWYIENIHPGTYGLPKPWYFPFTKSYWCDGYAEMEACSVKQLFGIKKKRKYFLLDDTDEGTGSSYAGNKSHFEEEPTGVQVGVKIKDLTKVFDSSKPPALNKLNLTLYEGQITSFLGHNGAGKTTTMSLLTGLYPATTGSAHIYGNDISRDMDVIRQSLGICPQHNVLFDKLTVEEHLWFYARLKGKKTEDIAIETKIVLKDISLTEKRRYIPGCLSGGMQRKLSVAIAFVGGSKTVILDEPTSGVDPYSRRAIWNLLVKYKKGRTILLSTHHMDEAETLGDRIAVLSYGHLKCCGTPLFLKSSLGQGLHLYILKANETGIHECTNFEEEPTSTKILEKVKMFFPSAHIKNESLSEIHIILPLIMRQKEMCIYLFECLESEKDSLCIESYGIKDSTLEEVFVKVMEEEDTKGKVKEGGQLDSITQHSDRQIELDCLLERSGQEAQERCQPFSFIKGNFARQANHFRALTVKRFTYIKRNRKGIISQIILPAIFVSIAMTVALSAPSYDDLPPITLDPSQYYNVTLPHGNFIPYGNRKSAVQYNSSRRDADPGQILATFRLPSGIGATCVLKTPFNSSFDQDVLVALKSHPNKFKLFSEYFNKECRHVFQEEVYLDNYIPEADVIHNNSFGNVIEVARYYPTCQCKPDGVGFICNDGGYQNPPEFEVVTHAKLQDITGTNEHNFYLYTNDEYRLHRYGGLSVGVTFPYVPDSYNSDKKTRNVMKMVAVKENAHVWFNEKGYHSMPVYTNALNNAVLRANLPKSKGNPAAYGITLINHPMKNTNDFKDSDYIQGGTDAIMAIFIIIAMSFVPASFAVFLVHERKIKAKHLQFISGVNPVVYWLSNYVWDVCNYIIPTVCIIVILLAFNIPAYTAPGNFQAVVLLFLLYGWSIAPMMYPATMIFHEPSVAYIFLIVINLFTGITSVQSSFIFQLFSDNDAINSVRDIVADIFLIFPNYCLGNGLMEIALNHYKNEFHSHTGQYEKIVHPLIWQLTVKKLVVMTVSGVVMFLFTILCEYRFFIRKCATRQKSEEIAEYGDADVETERERVMFGSGRYDVLRIENLTKVYRTRKLGSIRAVDRLSLAIPSGECFGLLGVNGAGKTSLFKMLTGDIDPTSGNAFLETHSLLQNPQEFFKHIGYCPQFDALFDELAPVEQLHLYARLRGVVPKDENKFDALFDELTPVEKLHLYARFRGVVPKDENKVVNWALEKLSLCRYKDQLTGTLSGGNKRKLSTAISLLGNPRLIFMDEPTSGMDPYSRRFLWDTIRNLTTEGKSILFTSHSMEECEALCSRLSIMVNGQMKCLGSIQHLKNKYGDGYTISVITKSLDSAHSVQRYLEENIPCCVLCDTRYRTLTFEVKDLQEGLAGVFKVLETLLKTGNVEDYSVSQNTLDNVFINFSKQQKELAKDLEDTGEASNDVTDNDTLHHDYDEPLILLTSRNEPRRTPSYDTDEEILLA